VFIRGYNRICLAFRASAIYIHDMQASFWNLRDAKIDSLLLLLALLAAALLGARGILMATTARTQKTPRTIAAACRGKAFS